MEKEKKKKITGKVNNNQNIFNRKNSGDHWPAVMIRTVVHSATFSVVRILTCGAYYYYVPMVSVNRRL